MRILFIGDPFRWYRDATGSLRPSSLENVLWLYYNLHRALVSAGFEPPSMARVRAEVAAFFDGYRRVLSISPWAGQVALDEVWTKNYEQSTFTAPLADWLGDSDVMVIGFEIPPALKRFLTRCVIPYVSVRIGSHRFMRDLTFGMTSNNEKVGALLRQFMLGCDEIEAQVGYARATYAKKSREFPFSVTDSLFFIAQLPSDASLITGGEFSRVWHFDDKCRALAKQFPTLIYLQHPNMPADGLELAYFRSIFSQVLAVTDAGYAAIFTLEGKNFLTLSSSLGLEALSSGHSCDFLVRSPSSIGYSPGVDAVQYLELGHVSLSTSLWAQVLSAVRPRRFWQLVTVLASIRRGRVQRTEAFSAGANLLRNSLESWGGKALAYGGPLPVVGVNSCSPITSINDANGRLVPRGEESNEPEFCLEGGEQLAPLLHSGWHDYAQWGVWSNHEAVLRIDSRWMMGRRFGVTLRGRVYINNSAPSQELTIFVDGAMHFFSLVVEANATEDIKITIERVLHPIMVIAICVSNVTSPKKLGVSDDERDLGYGLRAILFRELDDQVTQLRVT